jgi:hypothetical protein
MIVSEEVRRIILLLQLRQLRQLALAVNVLNSLISTGVVEKNGLVGVPRRFSKLVAKLLSKLVGGFRCDVVTSSPSKVGLTVKLLAYIQVLT